MVSTQLLTYLWNNLYLPQLNILLYFTLDNHNSELTQKYIFLRPILKPQKIPPIPNNLLHYTRHLLPQPL